MSTMSNPPFSSSDVVTLHARYHDAMHGTFATDKHHNLPRQLRSSVSDRSRNISVLSSTPAPLDTRREKMSFPPQASILCTPQWSEFSDCVREVSPLVGEQDSDHDDNSADAGSCDGEERRTLASNESDEEREVVAEGEKTTSRLPPDRSVVDRLAALSQSADVDALAVAAALRDAEKLLKHSRSAHRQTPEVADGHQQWPTSEYRDGWNADVQGGERHSHHLRRHRDARRHSSPAQRGTRREGHGAGAALQPSKNGLRSNPNLFHYPPSQYSWPHTSSVNCAYTDSIPPQVAMTAAGASPETTTRWYEVYYAWMLYYQQLYAAQILQQEQEARRRRRIRHHQQQQEQRKRAASGGRVAHISVLQDGRGDGGAQRSATHNPATSKYVEEASDSRESKQRAASHHTPHKGVSPHRAIAREKERSRTQRSTSSHSDSAVGEAEVHRLRAQLRHLEEQLALFSASTRQSEGSGRRRAKSGDATHEQSQGAAQHPSMRQSSPAAKSKPAAATTWQALSDRQRSTSAAKAERRRYVAPHPQQRPQWR